MILHTIISEYKNLFRELRNAMMTESRSSTSERNTRGEDDSSNRSIKNAKLRPNAPALLILAVGVLGLITGCSSSNSQPKMPPPPMVDTSSPVQETITRYDEFTGRFRAIERVEIRARVDGYLEEIRFTDGELVEKGDLLFVIDQRPYRIALEQAQAELESAEARLNLTKKELKRAKNLRSSGAVSQELIDRRTQEYQSAIAAVSSAKAAVHSAELNIEFTKVKAPVSGKISENFVSVGNLISGGLSSATLLTRIVSFDPIYFTFEASEDKLIRYLKNGSFKGDGSTNGAAEQEVKAKLLDEDRFTHKGRLDFIDNEIDQSTGTLLVRAIFPNKNLLLTPGMFAKAKFSVAGRHRELLIPDKAIGSDQTQRYVLTVDDSSKVNRKVVKTGALHNDLRIIEDGLRRSDKVIVNGLSKVRAGQRVRVNQNEIAEISEGEHQ